MLIGIALSLTISLPSLSMPTSADNYTHFPWCEPLDYGGVHATKGSWYWYEEMGICRDANCNHEEWLAGSGWRYGGSYITLTKQINKSDFRSKGSGYETAKGIQLTEINGNPVEGFFLPLGIRDAVCN